MKKYLLGILTYFLLAFGLQVCWFSGLSFGYYGGEAIRGIYFVKPLTNRCTTKKRCNDPNCVTNIEYFNCDIVQVFINNLIYKE